MALEKIVNIPSDSSVVAYIIRTAKEINRETLIQLISNMDKDIQLRFAYAVAGIYNPVEIATVLPENVQLHNGDRDTDYGASVLEGYDYLLNRVYYIEKITRFRRFVNQEDAEEYSQTGKVCSYDNWEWGRDATEKFPFTGSWTSVSKDSCSFEDWMQAACK